MCAILTLTLIMQIYTILLLHCYTVYDYSLMHIFVHNSYAHYCISIHLIFSTYCSLPPGINSNKSISDSDLERVNYGVLALVTVTTAKMK